MSIHFSLCPPARLYNVQFEIAIVQLYFDININIQHFELWKRWDAEYYTVQEI